MWYDTVEEDWLTFYVCTVRRTEALDCVSL